MRFGLIAHAQMNRIISHSGVSRETGCLKIVGVFNFLPLCIREAKALVRSCVCTSSSDAIRTNISCVDQFIVLSKYNVSVEGH